MSMEQGAAVRKLPKLKQLLVLVALLCSAAIGEACSLSSLHNQEIWRHLQIGEWILQHKTWPVSGLFSQAEHLPWNDFDWGFDVPVAIAYRFMNLSAIPLLLMLFRVGLALVTFLLAGGWRNFWTATALSIVTQYLLFDFGPSPAYGSILFFGLELLLLNEVRATANSARVKLLPLVFLVWSNFDLGFVYGIGLYALFAAVLIAEKSGSFGVFGPANETKVQIRLNPVLAIGGLSLLATLLNPGWYHAYVAFFNGKFTVVNRYLPESSAMRFRQPHDYVLLLLVMAAFLSLGFFHSRDPFLILSLAACTVISFHSQREVWAASLASVAAMGQMLVPRFETQPSGRPSIWRIGMRVSTATAIALAFLFWLGIVPKDHTVLLAKIAKNYPVNAADYIRENHLAQPLFNTYDWGSFLTWYLPEYPVAIDDRTALYPETEREDYFKVVSLEMPYKNLPSMRSAQTLLLSKKDSLAEAFRQLEGFKVGYEDDMSIVYEHELND